MTTTATTVIARDLPTRSVIVDADGQRVCAVFDIEHRDDVVIVHTAYLDQHRGVPATVQYAPDAVLHLA